MIKSSGNCPLVSIIIPTRNSSKFLEACLISLKGQTYKNTELIIVDNNSTDSTKEIARKYTTNVFNKGPERTAQVNFGVQNAKGEYIYYTGSDLDRDCRLIEESVEKCEKNHCDAIYMNVKTRLNTVSNIWEKVRALERTLYYKQAGMNAARFYKKKAFLELNGYDEGLGGVSDDLEFQHRLDLNGYKTCFIDSCEYNTDEYSSLGVIIRKSIYYGWQIKRYADKHPDKIKRQYKVIRPEFLMNKNLLLENKVLLIGFIIYKFVQYLFGGIGFVLAKIFHNNKDIEKRLYKLNYS